MARAPPGRGPQLHVRVRPRRRHGVPARPPRRTTENRIDDVAGMLHARHPSRFMVWNISEEEYDYSRFGGAVQEFKFPGHPAPPLAVLFKIINSIESWLAADPENVAVVHCLTGRGRTVTLIACFLAWVGEFATATEALAFVAERRCVELERVVIPSQIRHALLLQRDGRHKAAIRAAAPQACHCQHDPQVLQKARANVRCRASPRNERRGRRRRGPGSCPCVSTSV